MARRDIIQRTRSRSATRRSIITWPLRGSITGRWRPTKFTFGRMAAMTFVIIDNISRPGLSAARAMTQLMGSEFDDTIDGGSGV